MESNVLKRNMHTERRHVNHAIDTNRLSALQNGDYHKWASIEFAVLFSHTHSIVSYSNWANKKTHTHNCMEYSHRWNSSMIRFELRTTLFIEKRKKNMSPKYQTINIDACNSEFIRAADFCLALSISSCSSLFLTNFAYKSKISSTHFGTYALCCRLISPWATQ